MTIDELCEILKAYGQSKKIQMCFNGAWEYIELSNWTILKLLKAELRVKPEPDEIWIAVLSDGSQINFGHNRDVAELFGSRSAGTKVKRYQEVLEGW